MAINKTWF